MPPTVSKSRTSPWTRTTSGHKNLHTREHSDTALPQADFDFGITSTAPSEAHPGSSTAETKRFLQAQDKRNDVGSTSFDNEIGFDASEFHGRQEEPMTQAHRA